MYSYDYDDIILRQAITPVGIREQGTVLIDHRGFIPFSAVSKKKDADQWTSLSSFFADIYQWFALPNGNIFNFCFGMDADEYFKQFDDFGFIEEAKVDLASQEQEQHGVISWIRFAHELCRNQGEAMFSASGGWSGFETAEAVSSVVIRNRILLFVSMRYRSVDRRGTGQILSAFEFLDDAFELVNYYPIYSTGLINRNSLAGVAQLAEIARPIAQLYLSA